MPLGLGCAGAVLPKGIVCDNCNRYLGQHVENEFMRSLPVSFSLSYVGIRSRKGRSRVVEDDRGNTLTSRGSSMVYRDSNGRAELHNKKELTFELAYRPQTFKKHGRATSRFLHKLFIEMTALNAAEERNNPVTAVTKADQDGRIRRYIRSPAKNDFRPYAYRHQLRGDKDCMDHPFVIGQTTLNSVKIFYAEILLAGYWFPLSGKTGDLEKAFATDAGEAFSAQLSADNPMVFK